jgi:hypothetical protein
MRSLLLSRDNAGKEWVRRLGLAAKHVQDAARVVDPAMSTEIQEVERIAGGLARLYIANLLAQEEQGYATEPTRSSRALGTVSEGFRGCSDTISIPDLLSFLQMQCASGILKVETGDEVISLEFDQGDLTNTYSNNSPPGFRLGEILVERGDIDAAQLKEFLVDFTPGKELLGNALQRKGLISAESLKFALESQVRLIFLRLLCFEQARYTFLRAPVEITNHRFNVLHMLLDASRIRDEAQSA